MMRRDNSIDMVNGPLLKNIIRFSLPLMATNLLQMMFNAADTIVVGKFAGQQALAAVGATSSLIFLITSLFNGLAMGTNVVLANAIGAQDEDRTIKSVHTSVGIGLYGGLLLTAVGFFGAKPMLQLMSTPADILDGSTLYMKIFFIGSIFACTYNFGAAIMRAKGDTKRPMYFLFLSGILNVVLNLIFVIIFKMSVAGVALATVISQAVSFFLVLWSLIKDESLLHLDVKKIKLDRILTMDILRIGVPAGIQGMAFAISNVVVQSSINSFNSSVIVAGNSAASNIENFVYIGMMAFSQAAMTFTSQNVGAGRKDRLLKIMIYTMILDCSMAFITGFITWRFGDFFLSFYTNDPKVVEYGLYRLFWIAFFLWLNGVLDIFINCLRGMGESTLPTILMIVAVCGVRLAWLWFYFPAHRELEVIYMCFPISWTISSIMEGILWYVKYKKMMAY